MQLAEHPCQRADRVGDRPTEHPRMKIERRTGHLDFDMGQTAQTRAERGDATSEDRRVRDHRHIGAQPRTLALDQGVEVE